MESRVPSLIISFLGLCSTPFYELISACGACQNRTWVTWATWSQYCPDYLTSDPGLFPLFIPDETLVPHWAYLAPADTGGSFSPENAKAAGGTYIMRAHPTVAQKACSGFLQMGLRAVDSDSRLPNWTSLVCSTNSARCSTSLHRPALKDPSVRAPFPKILALAQVRRHRHAHRGSAVPADA